MPNYDWGCVRDESHIFEKYVPLAEWKDKMTIPCEKCGADAKQVILPKRSGSFKPFIYYLNAAGEVRYAPDSVTPPPPGHTRCEITTLHEWRKFESRCNAEERSKISQAKEVEDAVSQYETSESRRELRTAMESMSQAGRDFAQVAIEHNNRKSRGYSHDPGLHFGILHNDERRR